MMESKRNDEVHVALDAALDELDDDSSSCASEHDAHVGSSTSPQLEDQATPAESASFGTDATRERRTVYGPPPPPSSQSSSALFTSKQVGDQVEDSLDSVMSSLIDRMSAPGPSNTADCSSVPSNALGNISAPSDGSMHQEVDMLRDLMKNLDSLSGGSQSAPVNEDSLLDGMMSQLLSKDLMYEPMVQLATQLPIWLEQQKTVLSNEEYNRRQEQCICLRQIVQVYETEPKNTSKIVQLMQQNQEQVH
jgi:Pex19 protein family